MRGIDKLKAFETLGVAPGSDQATIEAAWRELIRSYRPELAREDKVKAQSMLRRIDAAFLLLDVKPTAERHEEIRARTAKPTTPAPQHQPTPVRARTQSAAKPRLQAQPRTAEPRAEVIDRRPANHRFSGALRAMAPAQSADLVIYV